MIQPLAPQPTDTPALTPLLRQGDLEDVLLDLLEDTFRVTNSNVTWRGEDQYSLVVDSTMGGRVEATLYRDTYAVEPVEVAKVRLDYTVTAVQS